MNPYRPLDEAYRGFLELVAGQIARASRARARYEAERQRAEALAELDRAKTDVLLQRQPRVPHAADADARPGRGRARATPPTGRAGASGSTVVHRNALRLLKLVNTLLDFSRIEAGRAAARCCEPTDLGAFTADLASMFRSAIERAGLALVVDAPPEPRAGRTSTARCGSRIVLNLVSNAFKFTFEGEIRVTMRRADGEAVARGPRHRHGIPDAELPRLFERFHRVRGARSRTHEGSGHRARARAGAGPAARRQRRSATSERRRGDDVHASASRSPTAHTSRTHAAPTQRRRGLRRGGAALAAGRRVVGRRAGGGRRGAAERRDARPRRGARVLVADDNADLREYLARLLARYWDVETVGDGLAALEAVAARRPDLVLTDVMMPELDGFGLLNALRADPSTAQLPVIMLSARAGEEAARRGAVGRGRRLPGQAVLLTRADRAGAREPRPVRAAPGRRAGDRGR